MPNAVKDTIDDQKNQITDPVWIYHQIFFQKLLYQLWTLDLGFIVDKILCVLFEQKNLTKVVSEDLPIFNCSLVSFKHAFRFKIHQQSFISLIKKQIVMQKLIINWILHCRRAHLNSTLWNSWITFLIFYCLITSFQLSFLIF